jgi:[ribosomal protein S18]-alanine N-acetyltransferase
VSAGGGVWHVERLTDPADAAAVAALEAATFRRAPAPEPIARDIAQSDVARVYALRAPGGRVLGFCTCWLLFDELHIQNMAVDPGIRRRGAATALMRHVLAEAAAAGATRATLEVRAANHAARRLYETLGFQVAAVRRGYYANPPDDGLILWREAGAAELPDHRLSPPADNS